MTGASPRMAVVGHVEWADFVAVPRLPRSGSILHATAVREGAGGGGAMAARVLASLGARCAFVCALGDDGRADAAGDELTALGIEVVAQRRSCAQRRVITFLTDDAERTIVVLGERLVPCGHVALEDAGGVYLTGGDAEAVRSARRARVLAVTPRAGEVLVESGVRFDAVVASAGDPGEEVRPDLRERAAHVVLTEGADGGSWSSADGTTGRWEAVDPPGPPADAYGCGDAFAAGLTYGLAAGLGIAEACALGARLGAAVFAAPAPSVGDLAHLAHPA